jgi:hypothetical protein
LRQTLQWRNTMKSINRVFWLGIALAGSCILADTMTGPSPLETVFVQFSDVHWAAANCAQLSFCNETLNLSFFLEETLTPVFGGDFNLVPQILPGSLQISGSVFGGGVIGSGHVNFTQDYMPFFASTGDEIDVHGNVPDLATGRGNFYLQPGEYSASDGFIYFWSCISQTCVSAFNEPGPISALALIQPASGTLKVVRVPEYGSTLGYLALDLIGVLCVSFVLQARLERRG